MTDDFTGPPSGNGRAALRRVVKKLMGFAVFTLVLIVVLTVALSATGWVRRIIPLRGVAHEIAHPISPARLKPDINSMTDDRLSAAWIGHATLLINLRGKWILTDPAFSERVGVETPWLGVVGQRRIIEPALSIEQLPKIDVIAISHAHMDHMDLPALRKLPKDATLVVPTGLEDLTAGLGFSKIVEIKWGEEKEVEGVKIFAFAARHWGERTPWEKTTRGYNSYIFANGGKSLLFASDTSYTDVFGAVTKQRPVDAAVFNLSAYEPKWFRQAHSTSEEVWRMFKQTGAKTLLPIHWGTFIVSQETIDDPMLWLRAVAGPEFYDKVKIRYIGEVWGEGDNMVDINTP
jgi:L-ascorbate metabolism protein UlaG (beta-lactamase superfamily)